MSTVVESTTLVLSTVVLVESVVEGVVVELPPQDARVTTRATIAIAV